MIGALTANAVSWKDCLYTSKPLVQQAAELAAVHTTLKSNELLCDHTSTQRPNLNRTATTTPLAKQSWGYQALGSVPYPRGHECTTTHSYLNITLIQRAANSVNEQKLLSV